jgi:YidC/Oxa1 family membrane protein insertase
MQDQGKRLLIAVALALGVMLIWTTMSPKEEPKPTTGSGQLGPKPATPQVGVAAGAAAAPGAPATPATAAPATDAPRPAEAPITLTFPNMVATFSNYCGGLKSWQLTDQRYSHDASKGYLLPEKSLMTVTDAAGKRVPPTPDQLAKLPDCGAFEVNFASPSTYFVPAHAVWRGEQLSKTQVRYTYSSPQLDVEKTFSVMPERYFVQMTVKVTAHTEARQQMAVTLYAFQDPAALKEGSSRVAARVWSSATFRKGEVVETDVEGVMSWPRCEPCNADMQRTTDVLQWTGFDHPYLLVGLAPRLGAGEQFEKHTRGSKGDDGLPVGFMRTDLFLPTVTLQPNVPVTRDVVGYLGPKNYDDLEQAEAAAGFPAGFTTVVDLGWFGFIGRPLLWLLQKFHTGVGNWGISIILLTFLVKGLTLYWTTRSMRSMKAMAALAPQMKVLQAKYADDKQRQQAETMALYKQHGVNPVAGCLPIVLQMPIWLALYRMLSSAGELFQQPFIPGWINDLTATDPFYILPAVLVATMFVQARLQPAAVDSTQQKFMQYGMPLMFGVMSFFFPAGLTLYMFTNTVLSALHSIYMNKFDKKSLASAALLKRNQEAATAAEAVSAAKSSAKSGAPAKAKAAAKPVIDAKATEVAADDSADDDGPDDEGPSGSASTGGARNRPRRKKRRR